MPTEPQKSHAMMREPSSKMSVSGQTRTAAENKHRAQVYASNKILQKVEQKRFEQLQIDVAAGEVAFNNSWQSDCSSGNPSPTYRTQHHPETLRSSSAGEKKNVKEFELILKEDGVTTTTTTKSRSRISSFDTKASTTSSQPRFGGV